MRDILVAHSPDPDDAFMFWAMIHGLVDTRGYNFIQVYHDIETLNQMCLRSEPDLSAASLAAFPYISKNYALLKAGSSTGLGYGPVIVAKDPIRPGELRGKTVAVPGLRTTAFLTARLAIREFQERVVSFDRIPEAVLSGQVEAGVLIHEAQLTYEEQGLTKVLDLGQWWQEKTGLPLVLGVNVIKRSLGNEVIRDVASVLEDSIRYGLEHRKEALEYAAGFGRGIPQKTLDSFVGMYVNKWTVAFDQQALEGARTLLKQAHQAKLIPETDLEPVG